MTFQRIMMASASALTLALCVEPAVAQTADTSEPAVETVIVTGVRASVRSAVDIKRNADQMVDSVVAEDIGKLPDNNVIEALQHVTGIQIRRDQAETNQLLIRGLPDIATLLNGREIFTSTGRFVTLQDIPAELLARVDVQKTSRADDIEGGIAGLIDVRLHRPLDFEGLEIAGSVQGTHSSLSGKNDWSGSGLISDRWQTSGGGEFGILADVSYSRRNYQEEILDNYISPLVPAAISPVPGSTGPGGLAYIPLTEGAQNIVGDRQRTAANVAMQWRPNAHTEFFAEAFYTKYRNPNNVDFFVGLPWICANPATATVFPGTDQVKTLTAACYDLTSDQAFVPKTDTYQVATGGTWTGDHVTLSTELDYTNSKFSQTGAILDTHYDPGTYTADFNYHGTGTPYMNVTADMRDPSIFVVRTFFDQWTEQKGDEVDWRGDLSYDVADGSSFFKTIDGGVRYVNRFAQNRQANGGPLDCDNPPDPSSPQYQYQLLKAASEACHGYGNSDNPGLPSLTLADLPGNAFHVTHGDEFDGDFGIKRWGDANPNWLVDQIKVLRALYGQDPSGPPADPSNSFDDREISYAGYVKANFAFQMGTTPVDGNIGLRVVRTEADLKGNTLIVTPHPPIPPDMSPTTYTFAYTATEQKHGTTDWLPSLNLRFLLQEDLFLRLAASRTVTHPTFAQLNPGLNLSGGTATLLGSGTSGNPSLSPVKSDNADVSLEYYFGPSSFVTGAVFYRKVDGYIQNAVNTQTVGGVDYAVTSPVNAPSGHIDGAEVGYTQFFDFLPGFLSGLGLQANATYVEGQFQFISKWSTNLVGIYEKGPVSVRVAYNWRSGFNAGGAPPGGHQPAVIFAKGQDWLDLSASYRVTDQFTVTLDATNLLNTQYQDYFGNQKVYPRDTRRFDQTVVLGLRYRM